MYLEGAHSPEVVTGVLGVDGGVAPVASSSSRLRLPLGGGGGGCVADDELCGRALPEPDAEPLAACGLPRLGGPGVAISNCSA